MQDSAFNPSGQPQAPEPMGFVDHPRFPESTSSMEQYFAAASSSGRTSAQPMPVDPIDSLRQQFCAYDASAFRSGSRSGNFSSPSSNPSVNVTTPPDTMKVATGFVPKIKKESFGSPSTAFLPTHSAFSPHIPSPVTTQAPQPAYTYASTMMMRDPMRGPMIPLAAVLSPFQSAGLSMGMQRFQTAPTIPAPPPEPEAKSRDVEREASESTPSETNKEQEGEEEDDESKSGTKKGKRCKKERNRLSAQECRKRKKQYLESLESQVKQLTEELMACKKELKTLKDQKSTAALEEEKIAAEHKRRSEELYARLKHAVQEQNGNAVLQDLVREIEVSSRIAPILVGRRGRQRISQGHYGYSHRKHGERTHAGLVQVSPVECDQRDQPV